MQEKSQKNRTKKKKTSIRVIKNSSRNNSKHDFHIDSHEIIDCPPKDQENEKKRAFVKRKSFPFNIKTWNDSLSDCPSTPLVAEDENFADEGGSIGSQTIKQQSDEKKVKEVSFPDSRTSYRRGLETQNPGLQLQDIENRYKLGKSSMYAWSSITDMDNTPNVNDLKWEKVPSSRTSIDDRISRRLREQRLSSEAAEQKTDKNNNSFVVKPANPRDEGTEESESGFPTYFSEGVDSESIATVTSSMSIPIPGFGEKPAIEVNKFKEESETGDSGFLRLLSWCCLSLRSDSDSRAWSCRDHYLGSCEGDHKGKDKRSH